MSKEIWNSLLKPLKNYSNFFRCGALSVGDQILSIDETIVENTSYTPEDVMSFLNGPSDRGFTQLQILPVHAIQRKGNKIYWNVYANKTTSFINKSKWEK